jgi:hypothetical protein
MFWAITNVSTPFLCNRAFATILLLEQGMAIATNRHSKWDTAIWDAQQAGPELWDLVRPKCR